MILGFGTLTSKSSAAELLGSNPYWQHDEVRKQKESLEEKGAEKRGRHQRDQAPGERARARGARRNLPSARVSGQAERRGAAAEIGLGTVVRTLEAVFPYSTDEY